MKIIKVNINDVNLRLDNFLSKTFINFKKSDKNLNIYYHIFTDGRDTKPNVSLKFIKQLETKKLK